MVSISMDFTIVRFFENDYLKANMCKKQTYFWDKDNISNLKSAVTTNAQKIYKICISLLTYLSSHLLSKNTLNIAIKTKMNIGIPEKMDFRK